MNDMTLDSVCRLCLTENFTHLNVFTNRSPCGEFVYEVLNFIYGLKICEGDGLPSKICLPCLWRMLEFHAYKKNVSYAELEIRKLLNRTVSNSDEVSREQANDNDVLGEDEIPMNNAGETPEDFENEREVSMEQKTGNEECAIPKDIHLPQNNLLEISVKDEIDIVDWEMPKELQSKVDIEEEHCSERHLSLEEDINCIANAEVSSEVVSPLMDLEAEEDECVLRSEKLEQLKIRISVEIEQQQEKSMERNKEVYDLLVSVKDEIDIVEWEIPNDLQSNVDIEEERCSDRQFSLEEVRNSIDNGLESSKVITSTMDLEEKEGVLRNEIVKQMKISLGVEAEQKEEESIVRNKEAYDLLSSETCEAIISECVRDRNESAEIIENGSSVVSNSENNDKIEEVMQEDVSNDGIEEEESFDALILESSDNLEESGATRSVTPVESKKKDFVCDVCKKSFVFKYNLGHHIRVHYNDRPFKCNKCGKAFKQYDVRRKHELLHLRNENRKKEDGNTSNPFSCDICAKKFKSQKGLLYHSNVHKNKYKCRICGQSFGCNSHLNVHLRIHTNEKPFSCKVCKMSFTQKGTLKAHLATHSDDRPFQCNVCHKRFKSQSDKNRHELLHLRRN